MDALSLHPYTSPASMENAGGWENLNKVYELGKAYGSPKKIWVTEVGFPTNLEGGVSEEFQGAMIAQMYLKALSVPYLEKVFWYWFGPDGPDRTWNEHNFGLVRNDYSLKPSYLVYQWMTHTFYDVLLAEEKEMGEGLTSLRITLPDKTWQVAWSRGDSREVALGFESEFPKVNISNCGLKPELLGQ